MGVAAAGPGVEESAMEAAKVRLRGQPAGCSEVSS